MRNAAWRFAWDSSPLRAGLQSAAKHPAVRTVAYLLGIEPSTFRLTGGRYLQTSSRYMEPRVGVDPTHLIYKTKVSGWLTGHLAVPDQGIEPRLSAPEAPVLPLNESGMNGSRRRCRSSYDELQRLICLPRPRDHYGKGDRIRTCSARFGRPAC